SFSTGGAVTLNTSGTSELLAVVLQGQTSSSTDAKVLAAGGNGRDFLLVRFNADGTPDTTFGAGGTGTPHSPGHVHERLGLALLAGGKTLAMGETDAATGGESLALARYNSNGTLDTTFGTGGKVVTNFAGQNQNPQPNTFLVQPDGKIVVAGAALITTGN